MQATNRSKPFLSMSDGRYRYTRADFGPLDTVPLHLDLLFDVKVRAGRRRGRREGCGRDDCPARVCQEDRTVVTAHTTFVHKGAAPLTTLSYATHAHSLSRTLSQRTPTNVVRHHPLPAPRLNASDLNVLSVELGASSVALGNSKAFVAHVAGFGARTPLPFTVDTAEKFLRVRLPA